MNRVACTLAVALAALAAWSPVALAAPGFSAPLTIAHDEHILCPALAGGSLAWTQTSSRYLLARKEKLVENLVSLAHVSDLAAPDLAPAETLEPTNGTAGCPAIAAAGSHRLLAAEVQTATPRSLLEAPLGGQLIVAEPGTPDRVLATHGLQPSVALAPDGSGVVAWVEYAGARRIEPKGPDHDVGPAYALYAARVNFDGSIGPSQLLTPAGEAYPTGELGEPEELIAPLAVADPDGTLLVAWSAQASSGGTRVQISVAAPGQPFAAPVLLGGEKEPGPEFDWLTIGSDGRGGHLVRWLSSGEGEKIASAYQPAAGAPFVPVHDLPKALAKDIPAAVAGSPQGGTLSLLTNRGSIGPPPFKGAGPNDAALAVVRYPRPAALPAYESLISEREAAATEILDAKLSVRADGSAAVVWIAVGSADGGRTARVMLSRAAPGGRFSRPVPITGLAPLVSDVSSAFDGDGVLRIAWSTALALRRDDAGLRDMRLQAVVEQPGASDPFAAAGPRLRLSAPRARPGSGAVSVAVTVDRPCLVRLQTEVDGRLDLVGELAGVSAYLPAGTTRIAGEGTGPWRVLPRHARVGIIAYASDEAGASSATSIPLRVKGGGLSPRPLRLPRSPPVR
jgi:hypothetical protein